MAEIAKLLIANRGEIAVRIIRTCREMGIATAAIFSDADAHALHVLLANEAYHIGPAPALESYLNQQKIIEIAQKARVDAIHPGYGFLSENAAFARRVEQAGIIFIGPTAKTIAGMGDKTVAKALAKKTGIPIIEGSEAALKTFSEVREIATKISYPILLKAAAGGGGKGMRIVEKAADLKSQFERATSEAKAAFGDARIFVEKYLEHPRHIELQILADQHGNAVHLFERECSIQRRHQKIIEEAPCAFISESLRTQLGEAALKLTKACNYTNAGTVEFLVDQNNNFYFLEMNTRLQVEHPVTECITGLDLVRKQIEIAQGQNLNFQQSDLIKPQGHAIEVRINAENPQNNFLPGSGKIEAIVATEGPGVRIDCGFQQGDEVTVFYDSLLAKLIVHAEHRAAAIARMQRVLNEFAIVGLDSNTEFCGAILQSEAFQRGDISTHFLQMHDFSEQLTPIDVEKLPEEEKALIEAAQKAYRKFLEKNKTQPGKKASTSNWKLRGRKSQFN